MTGNEDPSFNSIADLCLDPSYSIYAIAAALELKGFYTWDKLGRFIYVSPDKKIHEKLCEDLLNYLSVANKEGYEFDEDYFCTPSQGLTRLECSGWPDSDLPDFDKLRSEWNQKYLGEKTESISLESVKESNPAAQSKVWQLLEYLFECKFGKDKLADIQKSYSTQVEVVCDVLKNDGVIITSKTLKGLLTKKIKDK